MRIYEWLTNNIERVSTTLERVEGGRDIFCTPDCERNHLEANGAGNGLNFCHVQHGDRTAGIGQDRQSAEARNDLTQKF